MQQRPSRAAIAAVADGSVDGAYAASYGYLDAAVELYLNGHITAQELGHEHQGLRNTIALLIARRAERITRRNGDAPTDAPT
jgi:hypothetical protein